jgi:hypothetical protein
VCKRKRRVRCPACGEWSVLIPLSAEAGDRSGKFIRACPRCLPAIVRRRSEDLGPDPEPVPDDKGKGRA